jgi:hypothetical protein
MFSQVFFEEILIPQEMLYFMIGNYLMFGIIVAHGLFSLPHLEWKPKIIKLGTISGLVRSFLLSPFRVLLYSTFLHGAESKEKENKTATTQKHTRKETRTSEN